MGSINKKEFYYDSYDNRTKIHAVMWIPEGEIKGILQISHGMLEHIERYDNFAREMAKNNILVTGNDHLGHGYSIASEEDRGYFADDGNKVLIEDIHNLMISTKKQYPDIQYFILGHSMGSFLLRQFISLYGSEINGAIIMGTGHQPYPLIKSGVLIARLIALFKGWNHRSTFVDKLAIGRYNKAFEPGRTSKDWLTRDEKIVDDYIADQKISFMFTLNAYYNMFKGMLFLYNKNQLKNTPLKLPLYLVSGKNDPVGNFGKDVIKVYEQYKKLGIINVSYKLYDDSRHEILNETNKEDVYSDILKWLRNYTGK